jgi:pilus assembly protein CpaC
MKPKTGGLMFAVIFIIGAGEPKAENAQTDEVMLIVGDQRVLDATDVASFSESTRGVIEVKVPRNGRRMIVTAIRPGVTSLLLIHRGGRDRTLLINVFSRKPEVITNELKTLLGDLHGVGFRRVGPRIFIEGSVPTEADRQRINQVARVYGGQVVSLAKVDADTVRPRTNIRLDLFFVELRRSSDYKLGIAWPGSYGSSAVMSGTLDLMTGGMTAALRVVDQALPSLEAASRFGVARIRKRATVITVSGRKATYEAGGEVNVAVAGSQAAELRRVPYGARLIVTPRLGSSGDRLDLEVEAEVSDLTETTQDVPGRTISRVETMVHMELGQSILLSGLDAESERDTKTGLPGLSRIPVLGLLFGTKKHQKERHEGLIIITPTVLDNMDRHGKRLLEKALKRFSTFQNRGQKQLKPLID